MIALRDLWEVFKELGAEGISALEAAEESVTYGTNCFEVVVSERPYVALRFHYDPYNEVVRPIVLRIHINKKQFKADKKLVESTLPALISAEEDEDWLSIALRPPKGNAKEVLTTAMNVAEKLQKALGADARVGVLGHLPVDCGPFLDYSSG